MKVLFVITRSEKGGAQRHVLDLVQHFAAADGAQSSVEVGVLSGEKGWLLDEAEKCGAHTFYVPELARSVEVWRDLAAGRAIASVIRRFRPDLVHAHSSKAGALAAVAAKLSRTPSVFTAHGWSFDGGSSPAGKVASLAAELALRPLRSAVITVSEKDRNLAERFRLVRRSKLFCVRNGVRDHGCLADVESLQHPVRVITVTRIAKQKDTGTLLLAVAKTLGPLQLTIVGDGPERMQMESVRDALGLQAKVHFLGERDDIPALLQSAQVYVLSSKWEGLPLSILEAMASGLPIVASDVGGVRECVDERNGILVPPGDPQSLADALDRLGTSASDRATLGHGSRLRFRTEFLLDRMVSETVSVYEKILG